MEPLIRTFDDWQTAPASAIRSWMAENVTVTVSEYRRNANDLQRDLGPTVANAFAAAIAPTMPLAISSLSLDAAAATARATRNTVRLMLRPFGCRRCR